MKSQGFNVIIGETAWKQDKAKSAPANVRGHEFNEMIKDDGIDVLIPPWGGELLIEALEFIDFDALQDKWIVGYSDISVLLLAVTLTTGLATAHGANLIDLRGEYSDDTTALWHAVLGHQWVSPLCSIHLLNISGNGSMMCLRHAFFI